MNFFLFWISEIFLTWMVSRLSSCDFFSCQAVVSREAYAWRMLSSFGWKPVLRQARSQALDTTGQIRRMPPHGQDYTPNPCQDADDGTSGRDEVSITHHHPANPWSTWPTDSGSLQCKNWGDFTQNQPVSPLGKTVRLWDLPMDAPKLKVGSPNAFFLIFKKIFLFNFYFFKVW